MVMIVKIFKASAPGDYDRLIDNAYIALNNCKDPWGIDFWETVILQLCKRAGRLN